MNMYKLAWEITFILLSVTGALYLFDIIINETSRNKINGYKLAWEITFILLNIIVGICFFRKMLDTLSMLPNLIIYVVNL